MLPCNWREEAEATAECSGVEIESQEGFDQKVEHSLKRKRTRRLRHLNKIQSPTRELLQTNKKSVTIVVASI